MNTLVELAKIAHAAEADGDFYQVCEVGWALEAAIRRLGLHPRPALWWLCLGRWTSAPDLIHGLARIVGGGMDAAPTRYRTRLLGELVKACRKNGHPWIEGESEWLKRGIRRAIIGDKW